MAERRKTQAARDDEMPVRRRPARRHEPEPLDEVEQELVDDDEREFVDEGEAEPAGEDDLGGEGESRRAGPRVDGRRQAVRGDGSALTAKEAARAALRQIAELTDKQPESVTDVERTGDGWRIGVEIVEDRRIPSSTDVLATYQATIDANGDLMSYRRVRRYSRGRGDSSEGS
jgi:Gas vesicle synthesis protein GvpO